MRASKAPLAQSYRDKILLFPNSMLTFGLPLEKSYQIVATFDLFTFCNLDWCNTHIPTSKLGKT